MCEPWERLLFNLAVCLWMLASSYFFYNLYFGFNSWAMMANDLKNSFVGASVEL